MKKCGREGEGPRKEVEMGSQMSESYQRINMNKSTPTPSQIRHTSGLQHHHA